jgi:ATP adenylyltransferase
LNSIKPGAKIASGFINLNYRLKMKRLWAPWRMEYIVQAQESDEGCIFCDKPKENDDEKNLIVYRSKLCFVMLNKYPYNNGHLMIVPYIHESDLAKVSDEIALEMHHVINKSLVALNNTIKPHGINIGINLGRTAGAGIDDHIHYHIVPRWNGDTNFMPVIAETKVLSEALKKTWKKLSDEFQRLK